MNLRSYSGLIERCADGSYGHRLWNELTFDKGEITGGTSYHQRPFIWMSGLLIRELGLREGFHLNVHEINEQSDCTGELDERLSGGHVCPKVYTVQELRNESGFLYRDDSTPNGFVFEVFDPKTAKGTNYERVLRLSCKVPDSCGFSILHGILTQSIFAFETNFSHWKIEK